MPGLCSLLASCALLCLLRPPAPSCARGQLTGVSSSVEAERRLPARRPRTQLPVAALQSQDTGQQISHTSHNLDTIFHITVLPIYPQVDCSCASVSRARAWCTLYTLYTSVPALYTSVAGPGGGCRLHTVFATNCPPRSGRH